MMPPRLIFARSFQFTHPGKGATCQWQSGSACVAGFNSRTLGRVRRDLSVVYELIEPVSIHAPWEGCDLSNRDLLRIRQSFNSRTLGRVRLNPPTPSLIKPLFQFTHPGKGATDFKVLRLELSPVSIHAPWEGCDP